MAVGVPQLDAPQCTIGSAPMLPRDPGSPISAWPTRSMPHHAGPCRLARCMAAAVAEKHGICSLWGQSTAHPAADRRSRQREGVTEVQQLPQSGWRRIGAGAGGRDGQNAGCGRLAVPRE